MAYNRFNGFGILKSTIMSLPTGNGPSGICLSYLLSGYVPYLDPAVGHPNPILYHKLQKAKHVPIIEQVRYRW